MDVCSFSSAPTMIIVYSVGKKRKKHVLRGKAKIILYLLVGLRCTYKVRIIVQHTTLYSVFSSNLEGDPSLSASIGILPYCAVLRDPFSTVCPPLLTRAMVLVPTIQPLAFQCPRKLVSRDLCRGKNENQHVTGVRSLVRRGLRTETGSILNVICKSVAPETLMCMALTM